MLRLPHKHACKVNINHASNCSIYDKIDKYYKIYKATNCIQQNILLNNMFRERVTVQSVPPLMVFHSCCRSQTFHTHTHTHTHIIIVVEKYSHSYTS